MTHVYEKLWIQAGSRTRFSLPYDAAQPSFLINRLGEATHCRLTVPEFAESGDKPFTFLCVPAAWRYVHFLI